MAGHSDNDQGTIPNRLTEVGFGNQVLWKWYVGQILFICVCQTNLFEANFVMSPEFDAMVVSGKDQRKRCSPGSSAENRDLHYCIVNLVSTALSYVDQA